MTLDSNPIAASNALHYAADRRNGEQPRLRCGICGALSDDPAHVIGSDACFDRRTELLTKSEPDVAEDFASPEDE